MLPNYVRIVASYGPRVQCIGFERKCKFDLDYVFQENYLNIGPKYEMVNVKIHIQDERGPKMRENRNFLKPLRGPPAAFGPRAAVCTPL